MPHDTSPDRTSIVRSILDQVKREGRSALTAPEGKRVCDAFGIAVPKEGVAHSAKEAAGLAAELGFPVVMKIVSPDIRRTEDHRRGRVRLRPDPGQCPRLQAGRHDRRRPGPADAAGCAGGHHRRRHRSELWQARRLRAGRRPCRGVEGHHLPPGADLDGGRALNARRHSGGRDPEGRARFRSGRPRVARPVDPACFRARRRLPRDRRDGPQPGLRDEHRRHCGRRAHRRRLRGEAAAPPTERGRDPPGDEPHHEAGCSRGGRRLVGGRRSATR